MDNRVVDVASYDIGNNSERHLYVEHNVKGINVKVVEPQCIDLAEGTESTEGEEESFGSDDDPGRVRFKDSEDERITRLDVVFEVIEVEGPKDGTKRVEIKGKSYRNKVYVTKSPKKKLTPKKMKMKLVAHVRIAKAHKRIYEREYQYVSDEMGGSYPDISEDEKLLKYKKFRKEQLGKDYE